ncbi:hypothetical protein AB0O01_23940 [Streptomyces sp. NPDC093252]|uniref:hypothetical protein n=1 Tax=Streptomyces sp. NPDC093252 TaxID=3154980 RepID=UPI0034250EE7
MMLTIDPFGSSFNITPDMLRVLAFRLPVHVFLSTGSVPHKRPGHPAHHSGDGMPPTRM